MREILYRGKAINRDANRQSRTDYNNGDWVFGLISKLSEHTAEMTDENGVSGIEVDPETLGEYIGNEDKNDYMIFEGDILERKYNNGEYIERCVIRSVLSDMGYCFCFDGFNYDLDIDTERCKIIGNIHDNQNLLEDNE